MAIHHHRSAQDSHNEPGPRVNRQRGKGLTTVVPVPDNHLAVAASKEAIGCTVHLLVRSLRILIFGIGVILPADTDYAFSVRDAEDGLRFAPMPSSDQY